MNPVTAREIKERFRRSRVAWFVTVWVLGIGMLAYLAYLLAFFVADQSFGFGGQLLASAFIGRLILEVLLLLLLTAVILVVPGLVALAVVGERERLTLPLLQVTQLSPWQLVVGKLGSSLAYLLLLLVAVAPVLAIPSLFGGVDLGDMFGGLGMIGATAVVIGCISIWVSARAHSSRGAVAGAYLWSFVLAFVTLFLLVGELFLFKPSPTEFFGEDGRELYTLWPNPYFGMVAAVEAPLAVRSDFFPSAFSPMTATLLRRQGIRADVSGFIQGIPAGRVEQVGGEQRVVPIRGSLWVRTLVIYAALSVLALRRAATMVRVPARTTFRLKRVRSAPA